jgi:hypothetical protein
MSRSGGFLIRQGTLRSLSEPSSSDRCARAAARAPGHARAQCIGDRRDAEPLCRRAGDDRVLRTGVDDEVLRRGIVHLRTNHDFVVHETKVDGVQVIVRAGIGFKRHPLAERPEEPDLRARPVGLLAVILVRQQVDVVRERGGRLLVLVHPLEDRADGVMDFEIAGREAQRRLRFAERLVQPRPRCERR